MMKKSFSLAKPRHFFLLAAILALSCFVACQPTSSPLQPKEEEIHSDSQEPLPGDWLIQQLGAEPQTLNPITASDFYESIVNRSIYESLLSRNLKTLELEPQLAESWEISDDKKTFTFRLRENLLWHDGAPLTVDDIRYSYERIQDPHVKAPHLRLYYNDVESLEILDAHTIQFKVKKPYFKHLELLGGFPILPRHIWDNGTDFNKHPASRQPIGSGPYRFLKWSTGKEIVLERHRAWHGLKRDEKSYPERLVFKFIHEPSVALQLLKNGTIDLYDRIQPIQWVKQLSAPKWNEKFHKVAYDLPAYSFIGWNMRRKPFDDLRVRQALDKLINRNKIIDKAYFGLATPTSGFLFPKDPSYNHEVLPTTYDPEGAQQLFKKAGWEDTNGDGILDKKGEPFRFTLLISAGNPRGEKIALILKEDLKKAGIQMDILRLEWAVMKNLVNEWQFDAISMGWVLGWESDPYQIWHSSQANLKNSSNSIGYQNPKADQLIEKARREFDPQKRQALYRKLHEIIYNDYPVSFLVVPKQLMAIDKRWQGIEIYAPQPCYEMRLWFVPQSRQKF